MASQIELSDDYVYYFGLYLIRKEDGSENASKFHFSSNISSPIYKHLSSVYTEPPKTKKCSDVVNIDLYYTTERAGGGGTHSGTILLALT